MLSDWTPESLSLLDLRRIRQAIRRGWPVSDEVRDTSFFTYAMKEGAFVLVLNKGHPFYRKVYLPLVENETTANKDLRASIELLILAAARAEAATPKESHREILGQARKAWSDNLATFLNG